MLHNDITFSVNTTLDTADHSDDLNDINNEMQYDVNEELTGNTKADNYACDEDNLEELLTPGITTYNIHNDNKMTALTALF